MPYLLDTDWIIQILKGHRPTVDTFRELADEAIAVSLINVGEVYEGVLGAADPPARLAEFRRFLRPLVVLNLSDGIMERFAGVRLDLRRRGQLVPDFDILIGATALHHDLTLLTYNTGHFRRIPGLKIHSST